MTVRKRAPAKRRNQRVTISITDNQDGTCRFDFKFRFAVTAGPATTQAEIWAAEIFKFIQQRERELDAAQDATQQEEQPSGN